jgi:AhpD family alkylhydroperoxidase
LNNNQIFEDKAIMSKFQRRRYRKFGGYLSDFKYILSNRPLLRETLKDGVIPPAFRKRLMLVVTQVNGCRYGSYFHAKEALNAGVSPDELKSLLGKDIPEGCPPEEFTALTFAQHWAEFNAVPEPEAVQRLLDAYGQDLLDSILVVLRMIKMGNLIGNLWDYLISRLTFGRFGLMAYEKTS